MMTIVVTAAWCGTQKKGYFSFFVANMGAVSNNEV